MGGWQSQVHQPDGTPRPSMAGRSDIHAGAGWWQPSGFRLGGKAATISPGSLSAALPSGFTDLLVVDRGRYRRQEKTG